MTFLGGVDDFLSGADDLLDGAVTTYLLYLALQPLDPLLQVVILTVQCHQLQAEVGAFTLQLVRLRLKALRLQAQMTVLLQQVGALLLLQTHRQTGLKI